eukprot:gene40139-53031_t
MKLKLSLIAAAMALTAGAAMAQKAQGVSKNEVVLGSIQDLSGPLAGFGKQVRLGMMLRVDEVNEQGGINGRKFKLLVEDSAYDPRRAVLAAQKLVNQDNIFAMIGHIGTAQNMAAMPVWCAAAPRAALRPSCNPARSWMWLGAQGWMITSAPSPWNPCGPARGCCQTGWRWQ